MEDSIFNYLSYRELIKNQSKKLGISFKSIASATRIHTSYFSRVIKDKGIFSQEQLFLIGKVLKLDSEEIDFLLLLGELNNSGDFTHQNHIKSKIQKISKEKAKILNRFKKQTKELTQTQIDEYYREAVTAKVHMLLTLKKYRENTNLICKKIFISEKKLQSELEKLTRLEIISFDEGLIQIIRYTVHLDESHDASTQNHINWRLETLKHLTDRRNDPSDFHLSVSFSGDETTKNKIKDLFKSFVVEAQAEVRNCKDVSDVYFLGMDLF